MLLNELFLIEAIDYSVVATNRFIDNFPKFSNMYPTFRENLLRFIEFRKKNRTDIPFNSKDGRLTGGSLGQLSARRVHIIFGKAIVIYEVKNHQIFLYDIIEHTGYEGKNIDSLASYIRSLSPNNFSPFVPGEAKTKTVKKPIEKLTNDQLETMIALYKLLAENPNDIEVLEKLARNDIDDFMDWAKISLNVDKDNDSYDNVIIKSLGGRNQMVKFAQMWLERVKKK